MSSSGSAGAASPRRKPRKSPTAGRENLQYMSKQRQQQQRATCGSLVPSKASESRNSSKSFRKSASAGSLLAKSSLLSITEEDHTESTAESTLSPSSSNGSLTKMPRARKSASDLRRSRSFGSAPSFSKSKSPKSSDTRKELRRMLKSSPTRSCSSPSLAASSTGVKRVRFSDKVQARKTLPLCSFTKEELAASYYTYEEIEAIKKDEEEEFQAAQKAAAASDNFSPTAVVKAPKIRSTRDIKTFTSLRSKMKEMKRSTSLDLLKKSQQRRKNRSSRQSSSKELPLPSKKAHSGKSENANGNNNSVGMLSKQSVQRLQLQLATGG